jgi:hypothetical protein
VIAWQLIVAAAAITAVAVGAASWLVGWPARMILDGAAGSFVLIIAWRAIANWIGLNGDFGPLVSVGDCGCLIAGALAPALLTRLSPNARSVTVPVITGGAAAFLVNVAIL